MSLVNINAKEAAGKLSVFRSFYLEISVVVLAAVVSYLFKVQRDMNATMTDYLLKDRSEMVHIVQQNNTALQENNILLTTLKNQK